MNRSCHCELEARRLGLSLVCQWVKILLQCRGTQEISIRHLLSHGQSQRVRQDWSTKHEGNSKPMQRASHPEDRRLYKNVYQRIISFIEKVFMWTVPVDCSGTSLICVLMQATYLVTDLVLEDGQRVHQPDFGIEDTALDIWDQLLHTARCCGLSCVWCVVGASTSASMHSSLCHWYLLGSCDNQKCVQGWPVSWKQGGNGEGAMALGCE